MTSRPPIPGTIKTGRPISVARPTASSISERPAMRRIVGGPFRCAKTIANRMIAESRIEMLAVHQLSLACSIWVLGEAVDQCPDIPSAGEEADDLLHLGHATRK